MTSFLPISLEHVSFFSKALSLKHTHTHRIHCHLPRFKIVWLWQACRNGAQKKYTNEKIALDGKSAHRKQTVVLYQSILLFLLYLFSFLGNGVFVVKTSRVVETNGPLVLTFDLKPYIDKNENQTTEWWGNWRSCEIGTEMGGLCRVWCSWLLTHCYIFWRGWGWNAVKDECF